MKWLDFLYVALCGLSDYLLVSLILCGKGYVARTPVADAPVRFVADTLGVVPGCALAFLVLTVSSALFLRGASREELVQ